ncbi:methionine gamma-lyase [Paenibacillus baekrokdamisoli]|uniref:homocysteine desulfhydrase n=1 Tax=Paenibacillus baekrokdamisoli TaxID=1712516 RepID=A0A3G9IIN0_9BACL|nr:PLP-dependent aspartate aminotransferase family protein [Paenibacillus baekrokdamisoli]MBB3069186.1 cystathionine beta-lyase/cystathionine gamma-synthase [Paenibacillus baekrokdamisoli]BBH18840.1 methionine gamma-lyase [Paenibacillus baekrokdamisoli]
MSKLQGKEIKDAGMQTMLAHYGDETFHGAVVPPVFINTVFAFDSYESFQRSQWQDEAYYYSRVSNPTQQIAEKKLAALEKGEAAKLFASGMAAISSTLLHCLRQGDHVVCSYPIYNGTYQMLQSYLTKFGITVDFVDFRQLDQVRAAIKPNTKMLFCEGLSTFFMDVFDIPAVVQIAKEYELLTIMDNTCATPATLRPIEWGFDIVIHSASKYLCGHSDVTAGVVIASQEIIDGIAKSEVVLLGATLAPLEAWLLTRGLKTFGLRMKQHAESAKRIAVMLSSHPKVMRVNFPLLEQHEQHELAAGQFSGNTGLFSFELNGGAAVVARMMNRLQIFKIGVSWGGFESLVYSPGLGINPYQTSRTEHETRLERTIRLSVGLEDIEDLMEDMIEALDF